ncbi:MAG: EVE domain-containing protein [Nannocystaceae bacterium]
MKSEPDVYGIETLEREGRTGWDGIRNYQARNFMRDEMRVGDEVLFYHSNAKPPGVAGLARVSKLGLVDPSQFDSKSKYFDPKSDPEAPRWVMVEVAFVERFSQVLTLEWLKSQSSLSEMLVVQRGQRLSIQPVRARHFDLVVKAARRGVG